jgi:hypothetical protein
MDRFFPYSLLTSIAIHLHLESAGAQIVVRVLVKFGFDETSFPLIVAMKQILK